MKNYDSIFSLVVKSKNMFNVPWLIKYFFIFWDNAVSLNLTNCRGITFSLYCYLKEENTSEIGYTIHLCHS